MVYKDFRLNIELEENRYKKRSGSLQASGKSGNILSFDVWKTFTAERTGGTSVLKKSKDFSYIIKSFNQIQIVQSAV